MIARLLVVGIAVVAAGCGNGGRGGGMPAAPSPAAASLAISPATESLLIQGLEIFSVTATFPDGTSRPAGATWSSDAPAVAQVDGTGRVDGVGPGTATITAEAEGLRATRFMRVIPDYAGDWRGGIRITACVSEGAWSSMRYCDIYDAGSGIGIRLKLKQAHDEVEGGVSFGRTFGSVRGRIRTSGALVLEGSYTETFPESVPMEIAVSNWETLSVDNRQMTGRLRTTFRVSGRTGFAQLDYEVRELRKDIGNGKP